jgi:predicted transcriptional regulator
MKNFFNNVRNAGPLKTRNFFEVQPAMVDRFGNLTLLELMNTMSALKDRRLASLELTEEFLAKVLNIEVKMYDQAALGDTLSIESCFVQNGKRQVDLKIYMSKQQKGQPAKRLCKAVYTVAVQRVD